MNQPNLDYEEAINKLKNRILDLIPDNPHILNIINPFELFDVNGFKCDDDQLTLSQASLALTSAKKEYKEKMSEGLDWLEEDNNKEGL